MTSLKRKYYFRTFSLLEVLLSANYYRSVTPALTDSSSTRARAMAYRLLRHSLYDKDSVERLLEHPLEWYIVKYVVYSFQGCHILTITVSRSFARENKHAIEREQVVKLVRTIVEIGSERSSPFASAGLGRVPLTEPIMRAMISVAEHAEDSLRLICCETLVEIRK